MHGYSNVCTIIAVDEQDVDALEAAVELLAWAVTGLEPGVLGTAAAARLVRVFEKGERVCSTGKALAARRIADSRFWDADGHRSAADWLAAETGSTTAAARDLLDRAEEMAANPELDEGARSGEVSADAAKEIARTGRKDPAAARDLARAARRGKPLSELREAGQQARARAEDDAERAARQHAERRARAFTDAEGMWRLDAAAAPEVGAQFEALWRPWIDSVFARARREGRREPIEAYALDALLAMAKAAADPDLVRPGPVRAHAAARRARGAPSDPGGAARDDPADLDDHGGAVGPVDPGGPSGPRDPTGPGDPSRPRGPSGCGGGVPGDDDHDVGPDEGSDDELVLPARFGRSLGADCKVIIRVDHAALVRGFALEGEVCEIAGRGEVTVAAVRELVGSGDAFIVGLLTRGEDITRIVHHGRRPVALQRSALEWLYPTCAEPGCNAMARLANDHVTTWALTEHTTLPELQRLCEYHHARKTERDCDAIRAERAERAGHRRGRSDPSEAAVAGESSHPPRRSAGNAEVEGAGVEQVLLL